MVITAAHLSPLLALLFGILIFVFPRILNYLVALYLILSGLLGLGFLVVPARAAATHPTVLSPIYHPTAFSLVDCHHHTSSVRQRTEERRAKATNVMAALVVPDALMTSPLR